MSKYKQLTRDEQLIGKTIKELKRSDFELSIIFNDDTFCVIETKFYTDIEVCIAKYNVSETRKRTIFDNKYKL